MFHQRTRLHNLEMHGNFHSYAKKHLLVSHLWVRVCVCKHSHTQRSNWLWDSATCVGVCNGFHPMC